MQELVQHVQLETFEAFIAAQQRAAEAKMAAEYEERFEAYRAQLAHGAEASVAQARALIIDRVLTLHCPRCKAAFLDFDGCLALKCARRGCGCAFCGVCLEDCRNDAHTHVLRCRYTQGHMYGAADAVPAMQNAWRRDKIAEHLSPLSAQLADKVLASLKADFEGIGLCPESVRRAVSAARAVRTASPLHVAPVHQTAVFDRRADVLLRVMSTITMHQVLGRSGPHSRRSKAPARSAVLHWPVTQSTAQSIWMRRIRSAHHKLRAVCRRSKVPQA